MKVVFRPSFEEHVEYLAERQRKISSKTSSSAVTWMLFIFNLAVVPAVFLFKGLLAFAIAIFAINAFFMVVLLSWQQKTSLRAYYANFWPELEEYDCEIAIGEKGVECEHAGNLSLYPWKNVRSVEATDKLVYFDVGPTQVLVSKRAFSNTDDQQAFIKLALKLKNSQEESPE